MNIIGIIPARYASTRFPGKPLVDIGGKSMIQRVYEKASLCASLNKVVVATDDERIFKHVQNFGGNVLMTSENHSSGTSRLGEALVQLKTQNPDESFDIAVNVQGDEPFIQPTQIDLLISLFHSPEVHIGTLRQQLKTADDLFNPNVVKIVTDAVGKALYFSRSTIPYVRGKQLTEWFSHQVFFKHIGLYAYRVEVLKQILQLSPSPLETAESLEQLRWLYHGFNIFTAITDIETIGIDTPEDLSKLTNNF